jgi:hypothetical protein
MNFEARFCPASARPRVVHQRGFLAALLAFVCASALLCASARAAEEETHIFNATLSLTGDCSTSTGDPVPDPGCPEGEHPPKPFTKSSSVAVDPSGDRYVLSAGASSDGTEGRVDVFDATGKFLTEVPVRLPHYEGSVAVDSEGYLYVLAQPAATGEGELLRRFQPTKYVPASGEIEYASTADIAARFESSYSDSTVFVDPLNDHVLAAHAGAFTELSSAKEGNTVIETFGHGKLEGSNAYNLYFGSIAVDWSRERLYYADLEGDVLAGQGKSVVRAYSLRPSGPEGERELLFTIDGSSTPTGRFVSETRYLPISVDETTGDIFVGDLEAPTRRIYEFDDTGQPVSTIGGPFGSAGVYLLQMAYDNGENSPTKGYLFVPSGSGPAHSLAFEPKPDTGPPAVEGLSASDVTTSDAILHGSVNPNGVETTYRIEYTTQQDFADHGFEGATVLRQGTLGPASEGVAVSAPVGGLTPGTTYRFRVVAESSEGQDEAESSFTTFAEQVFSGCPNEPLRTGPSVLLPDCRAYELVTPTSTNGHLPLGTGEFMAFPNRQVSSSGDKLPYRISGAPLSGMEGTGSFNGDPYMATRTPSGWSSAYIGPSASFAPEIAVGPPSPDEEGYYGYFAGGGLGPARMGDFGTYIHYPDGRSEILGTGSLGRIENQAEIKMISEGGTHIIFFTGVVAGGNIQLEPEAAPDGTAAIYDRTPDGTTHVISMKPGNASFGAGEAAQIRGISLDGIGVAFEVDGRLFLRHDDEVTYEGVPQALSGHPVTCTPGERLAGATPRYQWLRDGTPIGGATGAVYTPRAADAGAELQCVVRARNSEGEAIAASDTLLVDRAHSGGPAPWGHANVTGKAAAGETLTCQPDAWSANPSLSFQWYENGREISGATGETYVVGASDEGTAIQCGITGTADGAQVLAFSPAAEPPAVPPSGPEPTLSNLTSPATKTSPEKEPQVGDQLKCEPGTWEGEPTFSYRWLRDGSPIGGATQAGYTVTAEDEGAALQCEVIAANEAGTMQGISGAHAVAPLDRSELPSGSLRVTGLFAQGHTLECEPGPWSGEPTFSYRWLRNGTPIAGATASSYTLTPEDREAVVECELRAENPAGTVLAIEGRFVNEKPSPMPVVSRLPVRTAGVPEGGNRLFYTLGGDLWRFDANGETTTRFSETGDAIPVYVSADGSTAYFTSETVVPGAGPNPQGEMPQEGEPNLYVSREGQVDYVATVTDRDVVGSEPGGGGVDGLGLWTNAVGSGRFGYVPARATSDGGVLLFKSRASLTGYESQGHAELYRYDSSENDLTCVSCNPTGAPAHADAELEQEADDNFKNLSSELFTKTAWIANLTEDGNRAFFETTEKLVAADGDGKKDIYEWEAQGSGSCAKPNGCIYLISSGQSASDDYLWAVSNSGDDVFFRSGDLLAGDTDETPSIFDARVKGGFPTPPAPPGECLGEACQPAAVVPNDPTPASSALEGAGNVPQQHSGAHRCPKGKRAVRRGGKRHCIRRHKTSKHKHHSHKKRRHAKGNGRAGR